MVALAPDHEALRAVATPALVVDGPALERNIAGMAAAARDAGVALRPHAKTHKSKDIAALQLRAGAVGVACATIREAEALTAGGIAGLLITSPTMGADKFARVADLNRRSGLTVVVDHPAQVEGLLAQLQRGDRPLGVAVDIDVGQARTGVTDPAMGVELARMIARQPGLIYAGIQGYAGHAQHIADPAERKTAGARAAAILRSVAKSLADAGMPPALITGAGTGTYKSDSLGPYNELQAGSYVFMDAEYAAIRDEAGHGPAFEPSLFVLATVVSVNRSGEVTVDAGTKALATNGPPPCRIVGASSGTAYSFAGDEHGILKAPAGASPPPLGARVLIGATHCDPTVNLHSALHVLKNGEVTIWTVQGRHCD